MSPGPTAGGDGRTDPARQLRDEATGIARIPIRQVSGTGQLPCGHRTPQTVCRCADEETGTREPGEVLPLGLGGLGPSVCLSSTDSGLGGSRCMSGWVLSRLRPLAWPPAGGRVRVPVAGTEARLLGRGHAAGPGTQPLCVCGRALPGAVRPQAAWHPGSASPARGGPLLCSVLGFSVCKVGPGEGPLCAVAGKTSWLCPLSWC